MNYKAAAPLLVFLLFACGAETDASTQGAEGAAPPSQTTATVLEDVASVDAAKLLAGDNPPIVLDIRTPSEFEGGHIEGALNIDFRADDFGAKIAELDKTKSYLIH